MRTGQGLIKMVMGIDQAGQNDMPRRIEHDFSWLTRLMPSGNQFYNCTPSTTIPRSASGANIASGSLIHIRVAARLDCATKTAIAFPRCYRAANHAATF
jgi:hypothetical protein